MLGALQPNKMECKLLYQKWDTDSLCLLLIVLEMRSHAMHLLSVRILGPKPKHQGRLFFYLFACSILCSFRCSARFVSTYVIQVSQSFWATKVNRKWARAFHETRGFQHPRNERDQYLAETWEGGWGKTESASIHFSFLRKYGGCTQ